MNRRGCGGLPPLMETIHAYMCACICVRIRLWLFAKPLAHHISGNFQLVTCVRGCKGGRWCLSASSGYCLPIRSRQGQQGRSCGSWRLPADSPASSMGVRCCLSVSALPSLKLSAWVAAGSWAWKMIQGATGGRCGRSAAVWVLSIHPLASRPAGAFLWFMAVAC